MTGEHTLQQRLVLVFSGFGMVLAVLSGGLLYAVYHDSEDAVQRRYLKAQLDHYLEHHSESDTSTVVVDRFVTVFRDLDAFPHALTSRLSGLKPGFYEIGDDWFEADSAGAQQVLVARGPGREVLVLTLDATPFEAREDVSISLLSAIGVAVAMVAIVGTALGVAVARSIVRPVVRLADQVRGGVPGNGAVSIDASDYPAEVGTLAHALRHAFDRIASFVQRERQFTANASHELRTPVTVITGAAELLAARKDASEPAFARPLERIRRATASMEEIIEVFLLLAREDTVRGSEAPVSVRAVVDDVVDNLHHLVEDRPVDVVVDLPDNVRLAANERVLAIVLGNFVRNAMQRTESGSVRITGGRDRIVVSDTGPGIPGHLLDRVTGRGVRGPSGGHGLGLAIVRTLCERCGWDLEIESTEGQGTHIVLRFGP